ncbi:hypothetical protein BP6252_11693 [Coleophoma cylindrospora]|uniref:Uncharacterized protein n=1 Tax=Coleophoma cylindrospora TaxID=1849047 RepID=A0A3D8QKT5_9HELO|nr:hypothetical protein BP6252_11693 [Coleophoma cylindrospora]
MTYTTFAAVLAGAFLVAFLCERLLGRLDAREPPAVYSKLPFLGHLVNMQRLQIEYIVRLSVRHKSLQAFTLKMLGTRLYIINDATLVQLVLRNTKTISFEPLELQFVVKTFRLDDRVKKILEYNAPNDEPTYLSELHTATSSSLMNGPALHEMNARVLECLFESLNGIGAEEQQKNLYDWIRYIFTQASAEALYGPQNPIKHDRSLIESLWDFDSELARLMLNILPQIVAPKAYKGRARLQAAFKKYYAGDHYKDGASLIKERLRIGLKWGLNMEDLASFELAILFATTTSTVPSGFWLICYIFSNQQLLESVRSEVETIVTRKTIDGVDTLTMDISAFQKSTPLLVASFQELLRLTNFGVPARSVLEDTILGSKYLLKKGALIQMPCGPLHQSSEIWGATAKSFDPHRFLAETKDALPTENRKKQTQGYFPFGGGKNLCPGRHFALTEVVGMVATLVYAFDFHMADGTPGIRVPRQGVQKIGSGIKKPGEETEVLVRRRPGWEGVRFKYEFQK